MMYCYRIGDIGSCWMVERQYYRDEAENYSMPPLVTLQLPIRVMHPPESGKLDPRCSILDLD